MSIKDEWVKKDLIVIVLKHFQYPDVPIISTKYIKRKKHIYYLVGLFLRKRNALGGSSHLLFVFFKQFFRVFMTRFFRGFYHVMEN
ncbi:MAG: hypothetical protein COS08_07380 [Euryarchaeota archaeon CG01_land_8_20_14_3_00_38_12]|nr:MAG: hypothetical protein COS08_07380 [Euryarchaeota archaeon CG01_land_8_20_14_3_00_38_12]PJB21214.1 MAG: hypothetical protein CO114_06525 [Euryarchaeota archaeon CG_4_9_14_3_um_filter_38_12]